MIRLKKLETKTVVLTLRERATIADVYYIFNLYSNGTQTNTIFTSDDISPSVERYNAFEWTEGTTFDLPIGSYDYSVYQTDINGSVDITGRKIVETGLLIIYDDNTTNIAYNGTQTIPEYSPQ